MNNYWLQLANTYYMLVKSTKKVYHAELGRQACLRAIEENRNNSVLKLLPPIPTDSRNWDRRKFLRY